MSKIVGLLFIVVLLSVAGGTVWLINAPIAPPTVTVTESIPDARIPH